MPSITIEHPEDDPILKAMVKHEMLNLIAQADEQGWISMRINEGMCGETLVMVSPGKLPKVVIAKVPLNGECELMELPVTSSHGLIKFLAGINRHLDELCENEAT